MAKTFWKIIEGSKIEIPEIQRDYAQGRIDERVKTIRYGIISNLLDALVSGKELNLSFIFGQSVDRTNQANFNKNKQSLEQMLQVLKEFSNSTGVNFESKVSPKPLDLSNDKLLIPFDGQQRLTTLFLLHLFIGVMAKKDLSNLSNFQYKTRESSTVFIEKLISNLFEVINDIDQSNNLLSYNIKNQSWFFSSWIKDPTVSGMLVMLDEIKNQAEAKNLDYEKAWVNLTEKRVISFDYFDIQEEGFDEDLYVKMNARGKGLTDFENFRAWLEKKFKGSDDLDKEWFKKIDKEWLDLFWKSKKEVENVDENFLAFFKNIALLTKIGNSDVITKELNKGKKWVNILNPNKYTSTSEYDEYDVFNIKALDFIFKILDILSSSSVDKLNIAIAEIWIPTFKGKSTEDFVELLLTKFDSLNLLHKTFIFSALKFLYTKGKPLNEYLDEDWMNFKSWLRLIRNLIYNTRIDDVSTYITAINTVGKFDKSVILNITEELNKVTYDEEKKWVVFFDTKQQKEEFAKNKIFSNNPQGKKWQELIVRAENHFYFYGQIGFLFKIANADILLFEHYLVKLEKLFSEAHVNSKEYILQSLFFAFDDTNQWLEAKTVNRYKFYKSASGTSRDRNENWRVIFNDEKKRNILKNVLDTIDCSTDSIRSVINSKKEEYTIDNWKYLILEKPQMLKNCSESLITIKEGKKVIRLLEKSQNYSRQRELRSFHYYNVLGLKDNRYIYTPFKSIRYFTGERNNFNPCLFFEDWKYKSCKYYMNCLFATNKFEIKLGVREDIGDTSIIDNTIRELLEEKLSFIYNEETNILLLSGILYSGLEEKLEEVFTILKEIK